MTALAVPDSRSGGWPWLLTAAGVLLVVAGLIGAERLAVAVFLGIQAANMLFFLRHLMFVAAATRAERQLRATLEDRRGALRYWPRVTVLIPCHNEEDVVDALVAAMAGLEYPRGRLQVILIDDGSKDRTGELLDRRSEGDSRISVLHRPPQSGGGKSGALNFAMPHVRGDVVVVFDADHRPHPDVVWRLARHFADPRVGAVQGRCRIHNGAMSPIAELVEIDYLAGYLVNEFGRDAVHRLPAYGGANCAVRVESLRALGGWNERSVVEDTDLTLRLVLEGQRVCYDVTAVDEEEAVTTLRRYWRQRYRWARGHQQVWRDYRRAVWRTPRLSPLAKVETTMFLLIYHTPVLAGLGLVLLAFWLAGVFHVDPRFDTYIFAFWTLLFLGPFLELGTGFLLSSGPRRRVLTLVLFVPMFFVGVALCTKAWVDGVVGRRYAWAKTARAPQAWYTGSSPGVDASPSGTA
jgi:1,2-diacylglycerol 3-beta-glucosyltransferase